jgi:hypothetical protein
MFYYFKDKHRLLVVKLEFKGHNYMFDSYEMELYSVDFFPFGKLSKLKSAAHFPLFVSLHFDI